MTRNSGRRGGRTAAVFAVARPGFDTELADLMRAAVIAAVSGCGWSVVHSGSLIVDPDDAERIAAEHTREGIDAAILVPATFVDGRFVAGIAPHLAVPLLIWAIPEPELGGRLRLNSLTGANLATSILVRQGIPFKYLYADPRTDQAKCSVGSWLNAVSAVSRLRGSVVAQVGTPPPGFFTSDVDRLRLQQLLGVRVEDLDLRAVFRSAAEVPADQYHSVIDEYRARVHGLDQLPEDQVVRSTQFYVALRNAVGDRGIAAVAVRCWPEFFGDYGAAACSTLSHLIGDGVPAACEADVLGAVSMLVAHLLSGQETYLGDLVHLDHERNTAIFWHCGVGAFPLASRHTGPVAGVQPNRGFGFALDHGLKDGVVTILRVGQTPDGLRVLAARGEALDAPKRFQGTTVEVRLAAPAATVLDTIMYGGYEHHFAIVWTDVLDGVVEVCRLLGVPCTTL